MFARQKFWVRAYAYAMVEAFLYSLLRSRVARDINKRDQAWHEALRPIFGSVPGAENSKAPKTPMEAETAAAAYSEAFHQMLFDRTVDLMAARTVALQSMNVDWFNLTPDQVQPHLDKIREEYHKLMAERIQKRGLEEFDRQTAGLETITEYPTRGIRTKEQRLRPPKKPIVWNGLVDARDLGCEEKKDA